MKINFIGQEYIVAAALRIISRKGQDTVSLSQILHFGEKLQNIFNDKNISICVLNHSYPQALDSYSDYFNIIEINHEKYFQAKNGVNFESFVVPNVDIAIIIEVCAEKEFL